MSEPTYFLHVPTEKRIGQMKRDADTAVKVLAGQVDHLKTLLQIACRVVKESGDLDLQLKLSRELMGDTDGPTC